MTVQHSKRLAGALMVASSLYATTVFAQTGGALAMGEPVGFYAGASLGVAKAKDACDLSGTGFAGSCDDTDQSWNIFAGYQFHPNIAVEVGYVDLGDVKAAGAIGGAPVNVRGEAEAFELVGVGSYLVAPNISIYARVGVFRWDQKGGARIGGAPFRTSDEGTDFTGGIGAQYRFTRNVAARLEWQHYNDVGGADVNILRAALRYNF